MLTEPSAGFVRQRDARGRRHVRFPREALRQELLDLPEIDDVALRANLRDIRTVNRLAGGTRVVLRHLPRLLQRIPAGEPVALLDLATGSGDIPRAIAARLRRSGRPFALTVTDVSPQILAEAKSQLAAAPDVTFAVCDARAAPFPDREFDVVLCSLALHHFSPEDAVAVLREMERLSRVGFILNDIRRSLPGYWGALAAAQLASRNVLTRHDMPLSVRRAYSPLELRVLLQRAGIERATISTHPLFRMAAVRVKDGP